MKVMTIAQIQDTDTEPKEHIRKIQFFSFFLSFVNKFH